LPPTRLPPARLRRRRRDLWDVSFSGPLVGGLASLALLLAGFYASSPDITPRCGCRTPGA
jgi:hypothetical protein